MRHTPGGVNATSAPNSPDPAPVRRAGYARVGHHASDRRAQTAALVALGVSPQDVHLDVGLTGTVEHPRLDALRTSLRTGDALVVTSFARMAGSLRAAAATLRALRDHGITLVVGDTLVYEPDDPRTTATIDGLLQAVAIEAGIVRLRTQAGIAHARAQGRTPGRRRQIDEDTRASIRQALASGQVSAADLSARHGIAISSVYRIASE